MRLATIVIMVALNIAAQAQEAPWPKVKTFIFQAQAGVISPRDAPYADRAGITLGGGLGLRFGRGISAIASGKYSGVPQNDNSVGALLPGSDSLKPKVAAESDFAFRHIEIALEGQYRFQYNPREPSAYLIGGVNYISLHRQKILAETTEPKVAAELSERTDNSYGYTVGLGVDWPFQRDQTAILGELRFSKGVVPIDGGNVSPYYLHFLAGVRVNL